MKINKLNRIDITKYSENELSLIVFNTEYLYRIKYNNNFLNLISLMYKHTLKQKEILINDIDQYKKGF